MRPPRKVKADFRRRIIKREIITEEKSMTSMGIYGKRKLVKVLCHLECGHIVQLHGNKCKENRTFFCDYCAEEEGYVFE